MTRPLFLSTIGTESRSAKFLTMKTVVRKPQKNDGHTQTHVLRGCTTFGTELKLGTFSFECNDACSSVQSCIPLCAVGRALR